MAELDDWVELTGLTTDRARFHRGAEGLVCDEVLWFRSVLDPDEAELLRCGRDDPVDDVEWRAALERTMIPGGRAALTLDDWEEVIDRLRHRGDR